MANYLLDTGVIVRHLRGERRVVQLLRGLGGLGRLSVSAITRLEVRAGMHPDERLATQKLLSRFLTYDLDRDIADRAGELIRFGRASNASLSVPDAIIAATAIHNHLTLVTYNLVHFGGITGLSLEPLPESE